MKPGVSIVIPTWNGLALLERFLPSVLEAGNRYVECSGAPVEIIIVDDGSTDQSAGWLEARGFVRQSPPAKDSERSLALKLVISDVNRGFGESCNRGFASAAHPLVLLTNNDVELDAGAIAPLVENFADDSVFAAHCRVIDIEAGKECGTGKVGGFSRGFIRVHQSYVPKLHAHSAGPLYSIFAGGGSALFDRQKFLELGGFDLLLSPFYWEDVELSYRAWKRGFTVLYEPRSVARHRVSSTIGKLDRGRVRRIEQRNRLIFHWIHLQDRRLMAAHFFWLLLLALSAPLRFKPGFIASVIAALKSLPAIRKRRLEERSAARRTDREVYEVFELLESRRDLVVYDRNE